MHVCLQNMKNNLKGDEMKLKVAVSGHNEKKYTAEVLGQSLLPRHDLLKKQLSQRLGTLVCML